MKDSSLYEASKELIAHAESFDWEMSPSWNKSLKKIKQALSAYSNTPDESGEGIVESIEIDIISFEDDWSRNPQEAFKMWKSKNYKPEVVHDTDNPVWLRGYFKGVEEAQSKAKIQAQTAEESGEGEIDWDKAAMLLYEKHNKFTPVDTPVGQKIFAGFLKDMHFLESKFPLQSKPESAVTEGEWKPMCLAPKDGTEIIMAEDSEGKVIQYVKWAEKSTCAGGKNFYNQWATTGTECEAGSDLPCDEGVMWKYPSESRLPAKAEK